jgi:hypothetical protein
VWSLRTTVDFRDRFGGPGAPALYFLPPTDPCTHGNV